MQLVWGWGGRRHQAGPGEGPSRGARARPAGVVGGGGAGVLKPRRAPTMHNTEAPQAGNGQAGH